MAGNFLKTGADLRFYTEDESKEWLTSRKRKLPDQTTAPVYTVGYPAEAHRYHYISHWIATSLTYRQPALLLIAEWGIWPSCENWHLYYKLRQGFGDQRLLHEAPGHLFLEYETEDLATFLQLGMLNGWGGYLLTGANYANLLFSHDEYFNFYADKDECLTLVREEFKNDTLKST